MPDAAPPSTATTRPSRPTPSADNIISPATLLVGILGCAREASMPRAALPAALSFLDVLNDPRLLRPWFGESWDMWRVFAKALFAEPMTDAEREAYTRY